MLDHFPEEDPWPTRAVHPEEPAPLWIKVSVWTAIGGFIVLLALAR